MITLSDTELLIIQNKAENAEKILTRAIENAEKEKEEISKIIEKVQDERHRRLDQEARKEFNNN